MGKHNFARLSINRQSGAVLIVGLVMVLLISIVALSGIRSSNLQEVMAGNTRDRNLAFQAAESALVAGEAIVDVNVTPPQCLDTASTCFRPTDNQNPEDSVIYLDGQDFEDMSRDANIDLSASGVGSVPRFIIEELSLIKPQDNSHLEGPHGAGLNVLLPYRITARATGLGNNSETAVILQSTYNRFPE